VSEWERAMQWGVGDELEERYHLATTLHINDTAWSAFEV
jgi:hypothetical protein